ncbi:S1 RNA-binding domain-containing protein [Candidatus Gracilibacteria bacterium]|jgi:small subunit ribosomal protein S1|nr:S1 RNA-binding domain-containing protein [Candidatus Gracilibacteria bacterium]
MANKYTKSALMDELIASSGVLNPPVPGTFVDGIVVSVVKNKVLVDLDGTSTGIISGQEANDSLNTLKTLQPGDSIYAYVLEEENEDGLIVLSLRKASQEKTWKKFVDAYESDKSIQVMANEANKGGLLLNIDGIKGFIPVSQLAPLHYPRVDGADSNEILARLGKLVGIPLTVRIINLDREGGKLILSEKAAEEETRGVALDKLDVGQKVKGRISGIVKFGIFVTFGGLEGLVHISEIAWGHVKDPRDYGRLGEDTEVMVIGKDKDKISLSMKRLTPDPWVEATKKYEVGTVVEGEINRITPFGAFMKLENDINGLIHVSEVTADENPDITQYLKVGEKVKAKVIAIDPEDHRVGLSIKAMSEKEEKKEEKKKKAKKEESEEKVEEVAEEEAK